MIKNCFTVDVEDGISACEIFWQKICQADRVVYVQYILDLLERKNIRRTFFALEKVAKKIHFLIENG